MIADLFANVLACIAYGLVGLVLMALGYLVVDLLTPGRLADLIWGQRQRGTAIVLAASLLSVSIVVATAILTSEAGLVAGLLSTFAYGLIGLVLMALSFLALDAVTPGKLAETLAEQDHPAIWVTASLHLGVGVMIAAAIS